MILTCLPFEMGVCNFDITKHPPTCPSCKEVFSYRYQLEWHFLWKHRAHGSLFICCDCNKSFTEKDEFKSHASIHRDGMRHSCEKCGSRFATELELKRHHLTHKRIMKKDPDTCSTCLSHTHTHNHSLSEPVEVPVQHAVPKSVSCRGCFSRKSFMVKHSRRNRLSDCTYLECIKEKVCKHGNCWTWSL